MNRSTLQRIVLAGTVVAVLAGCGGGPDASAEVEAAVQDQHPNRTVACGKTDAEYGGGHAYSCDVGGRKLCVALVDGEILELWEQRLLRPGERGFDPNIAATVRAGPSC